MLPAGRCSLDADPSLLPPQHPGGFTWEGQLPIALFDIALEPSAPSAAAAGGQQDGGGLFAMGAPVHTVQEGDEGEGVLV